MTSLEKSFLVLCCLQQGILKVLALKFSGTVKLVIGCELCKQCSLLREVPRSEGIILGLLG